MSNDFDFDLADNSAQDAIQFSAPVIFWKHGSGDFEELGGINHTGGFFFTYEQCGEGVTIDKWAESSFKGDGGSRVSGLAAKGARITIVRSRKRWFKDEGGQHTYRAWNNYEKGFRGQMQSVGFVQGYSSPVCFSFKGMTVSSVEEILRYHSAKVVSIANQSAPSGSKLPIYAFWMNVISGKHEEVGSGNSTSEVTMPELWLPKSLDVDFARQMYVGKDALIASQNLYRELDEWAGQWDRYAIESNVLGSSDIAAEREVKARFTEPRNADTKAVETADDIPFN
jgi:hypothetical protein